MEEFGRLAQLEVNAVFTSRRFNVLSATSNLISCFRFLDEGECLQLLRVVLVGCSKHSGESNRLKILGLNVLVVSV